MAPPATRSVGCLPCANRMQRAAADLSAACTPRVQQTPRPGSTTAVGRPRTTRWLQDPQRPARTPARCRPTTRLCAWKATACTKSPSARCTPASSSQATSAFRWWAKRCCGWKQRLGYKHKGIEQRFTQLPPLQAHRLAGRVSGDSTVAYAWAYCMALESACHGTRCPRAAWLRALMLERERVANHLGDLGALGNDAAFAFGLAQFSRLREDWQRLSMPTLGHRFMMDCIVPGGVACTT
jgi:hypothetical protein